MIYLNNEYKANSLTSGTTAVMWFGPIVVNHYDKLTLYIYNCSTAPVQIKLVASQDAALKYSMQIPVTHLENDDMAVRPEECHINSIKGSNPYQFISVLASATKSIDKSLCNLVITSKKE